MINLETFDLQGQSSSKVDLLQRLHWLSVPIRRWDRIAQTKVNDSRGKLKCHRADRDLDSLKNLQG